ncbi:unnamed protein product [Lactuca saligna]|uniref:Uncharacterized protein n=1 Tax=Lactuca saligna TaxID=75948 RepID=A0AA35VU98_LACSI|nr:unnamed protein product [Lactuca saligna]
MILMIKSPRNICGWWKNLDQWNRFSRGSYLWSKTYPILSSMFKKFEDHMSNHPTKAIVYTLSGFVTHLKIWICEIFPAIWGNGAIRHTYLYPRILCWFHIRMLTWTKFCDLFNVDQDEVHQPKKKKMIASDAEASTSHYQSYITSLNCELSEVPSSVRYNFRNDGASSSKTTCENSQSSKSTEQTHMVEINKNTTREIMARLESLEEEIRRLKIKDGTRDGDDLEHFFNDAFEKKKKKKVVVASDIMDAENHIPKPPVVKEGRPVRQLKPSQYLSSPYISHVDIWGRLLNKRRPNDARWTIMPSSFFGVFEMFQWAGSATGNPFDPLDGCKSWLEVYRVLGELWMDTLSLNLYDNFRLFDAMKIIDFVRFEELMDRILVEIEYWNHMGLPIQKASITVTDVTDVPQQDRIRSVFLGLPG